MKFGRLLGASTLLISLSCASYSFAAPAHSAEWNAPSYDFGKNQQYHHGGFGTYLNNAGMGFGETNKDFSFGAKERQGLNSNNESKADSHHSGAYHPGSHHHSHKNQKSCFSNYYGYCNCSVSPS